MVRKSFCLALLLLFSCLHTYQLCDASEDTAEDVAKCGELIAQKHLSWASPVAPDDDDDGAIPQILGQTLNPSGAHIYRRILEFSIAPFPLRFIQAVLINHVVQDRSPPYAHGRLSSPRISCLVLDRTPARSLAPPLA